MIEPIETRDCKEGAARKDMATIPPLPARLLREPFLHFMLLGGAVFWFLSEATPAESVESTDRIVISSAEVERMVMAWTQRWQRPPSEDELAGMVREAIREQVLYREAMALGLHEDDVVIRRHLRQKYEFITQDLAYDTEPDEATLRAYHVAQPDRYAQADRVSFHHILFSTDRRGPEAAADATQALTDLRAATSPEAADLLGDATSLPPGFDRMSAVDIAAMFGPDFATALSQLEPGRWSGPVTSGYGLHLIWLSERVAGGPIAFEAVRQRVKDDWIYEQRIAANEAIYRKLLERYDVVIEPVVTAGDNGDGS